MLLLGLSLPSHAQNVFASNYGDNTIHEFSSTGTDLGVFATGANGPTSMAFDSSGNLLVTDQDNNTIHQYSSTGTDLGDFTTTGINGPIGLLAEPAATATPEPGSIALLVGAGLTGVGIFARRK